MIKPPNTDTKLKLPGDFSTRVKALLDTPPGPQQAKSQRWVAAIGGATYELEVVGPD